MATQKQKKPTSWLTPKKMWLIILLFFALAGIRSCDDRITFGYPAVSLVYNPANDSSQLIPYGFILNIAFAIMLLFALQWFSKTKFCEQKAPYLKFGTLTFLWYFLIVEIIIILLSQFQNIPVVTHLFSAHLYAILIIFEQTTHILAGLYQSLPFLQALFPVADDLYYRASTKLLWPLVFFIGCYVKLIIDKCKKKNVKDEWKWITIGASGTILIILILGFINSFL